jgi:hypothetical protein
MKLGLLKLNHILLGFYTGYLFLFLVPVYLVRDHLRESPAELLRSNHQTRIEPAREQEIRQLLSEGFVYLYIDIDSLKRFNTESGEKVQASLWFNQVGSEHLAEIFPAAIPSNWNLDHKYEEEGELTRAHGLISHYRKITASYDVDVDYSRFPREILDFKFVVAGMRSTETIPGFKLLPPGVAFFQRFRMPGWDYLGHHAHSYSSSFHGTYGSEEFLKSFNSSDSTLWPRMDLHIQFRKEIFSGFVTVILPTLIITIVALLANYFPHGSESFTVGRAFPLLASCMFSLIALKFVFSGMVPNISYFIRYDLLYFYSLVCILTGLLANLVDTIALANDGRLRYLTSYSAFAMTSIGIGINTHFFLF